MADLEYPLPDEIEPTPVSCYGLPEKPITLSWSRLHDWMKCKQRTKLTFQKKKSKITNVRNFLAGSVADLSMREALDNAKKDSDGRLLELSLDELLAPVQSKWDKAITAVEDDAKDNSNRKVLAWSGLDPEKDQRELLNKILVTLKNLHPLIEERVVGHRFIPEFRPKRMPVIGIPGLNGETVFIQLFLAVDIAIQVKEGDSPTQLGDWGIYDLKTTSTEAYLEGTLPQLVFYDLAFSALTGKFPVEHELWAPLANPMVRRVQIDDSHRKQMINWIINFCHGVWKGEDSFTADASNCYNCPTKNACPKMTLPLTKDEQGISRFYFGDNTGGMLNG